MDRSDAPARLRAAGARPLTRRRAHRALLSLLAAASATGFLLAQEQGHSPEPARQTEPAPKTPEPTAADAIVARVNGTPIRRLDLDQAIASFRIENNVSPDLPEDQAQRIRQVVLEGLIGSVLLYQKALTIPIEVPQGDVDKALQQARGTMGEEGYRQDLERRGMTESDMVSLVRQNLTVQKLIQETVMNGMQVDEAAIRAFYEKNTAVMIRPEAVDASIIVVKSAATDPPEQRAVARQRIQQALDRVNAGEAFSDVARSMSEDGTASGGGALGWVPRGVMISEIETVLFALEPGHASGIVETPMALHLLKVTTRRPAGRMSLEEARSGIAEILKQQKSAETLKRMVADLRAAARIEIY